jgi:putative peptidoglycan lipid II flippase
MIGTILVFRHSPLTGLAVKLAWGTVIGCALQFAVQVRTVLRLAP